MPYLYAWRMSVSLSLWRIFDICADLESLPTWKKSIISQKTFVCVCVCLIKFLPEPMFKSEKLNTFFNYLLF